MPRPRLAGRGGVFVTPEEFGARPNEENADCGPALNEAAGTGKRVILGPNRYFFKTPIKRRWDNACAAPVIQGCGRDRTKLISDVDGPLIDYQASKPYKFSAGLEIDGLSIIGRGYRDNSAGIRLSSSTDFKLGQLYMENLSGPAVDLGNPDGDPTHTVRYDISNIMMVNCALDWGAAFNSGLHYQAGALVRGVHADRCGAGFHFKSATVDIRQCSAVYTRNGAGLRFSAAGQAVSRHPSVDGFYFEGNANGDCWLQSCIGADIRNSQHTDLYHYDSPEVKPYGYRFGMPTRNGYLKVLSDSAVMLTDGELTVDHTYLPIYIDGTPFSIAKVHGDIIHVTPIRGSNLELLSRTKNYWHIATGISWYNRITFPWFNVNYSNSKPALFYYESSASGNMVDRPYYQSMTADHIKHAGVGTGNMIRGLGEMQYRSLDTEI